MYSLIFFNLSLSSLSSCVASCSASLLRVTVWEGNVNMKKPFMRQKKNRKKKKKKTRGWDERGKQEVDEEAILLRFNRTGERALEYCEQRIGGFEPEGPFESSCAIGARGAH